MEVFRLYQSVRLGFFIFFENCNRWLFTIIGILEYLQGMYFHLYALINLFSFQNKTCDQASGFFYLSLWPHQ